MLTIESVKELKDFMKELELNSYDKEKLKDWQEELKDGWRLIAFESEEEAFEYLKEDAVNNWTLQYYTTQHLVDNLREELKGLEDVLYNVIKKIQEEDNADTTEDLLKLVDIDEVIHEAIRLDGVGHLVNHYDGVHLEVKHKESNTWYTLIIQ